MIEQGIVKLVQGNAQVTAFSTGGFLDQIPKGQALPAWTYMYLGGHRPHALKGERNLTMRRLQIDCYANGPTGADVITLASLIDDVLDGFSGTLSDTDSTVVDHCFLSDEPTDYPMDEASRTFRRMLEYEIWFFFLS